jgi:hypothetical protein
MKRIHTILIIGIIYALGVISAPLWIGLVSAYEESSGSWSATEKRQIIRLLESIDNNTQRIVNK